MMKARILSPEQTELQTQLRRDMRVSLKDTVDTEMHVGFIHKLTRISQSIQDRVTKMEDHLQGSKKKLNEFKTGKPSIK
jgi:nucleoporin NUP159